MFSLNENIDSIKIVISTNTWLDVLLYYKDFWLNIWTDNHIYKMQIILI